MALQYLSSFLKQVAFDQNVTLFMLLSFFISIALVLRERRRSKRNITLPPSPPKLPIIGNLHQIGTLPHRSFHSLSQKYGPLLLLHLGQLPVVLVSSVNLAKEVMQTQDIAFASRPQLTATRILLYGCKDVAYSSYGEEWRQKRKVCVIELLSLRKIQSTQFIREEEGDALIRKIREACSSSSNGCCVNLSEMLTATTVRIICRCIFGRKYDEADSCRFGEMVRKVMSQIPEFTLSDMFPVFGHWIEKITAQTHKYKSTFAEMDAIFDEAIALRKNMRDSFCQSQSQKENNNNDFLHSLLKLQRSGNAQFELTKPHLKALILDMFLGGTDTTATTLEWAMSELVKKPSIMKKVQEEVRKVVGSKSKFEEDDINQMGYMKCVIKETLRLHPPAALLVPRETATNVKLGEYDIPEKTTVYVNVWAIQRDPEFWERPEEFLPERFENNEVTFNGQYFQYIPFGSGRRKCPGMAFGLASTEYMLANLLHWFDWELCKSGEQSQELDMSEKNGLTITKKVSLCLKPIPYFDL